jgi:hypothetical protein
MQERVNYIVKLLGDSADTHAKELKALKAAHNKHTSDLEDSKLECTPRVAAGADGVH